MKAGKKYTREQIKKSYDTVPIKISELTNANSMTNDYQPMTKLPFMPQNLDPISTKKKGLAVD